MLIILPRGRNGVLAGQRIAPAIVEGEHVGSRKTLVADGQPRAAQAHGSGFFDGEAERLGGAVESAWPLGKGAGAVAAEIQLGGGQKILLVHSCLLGSGLDPAGVSPWRVGGVVPGA